jgi:hypothetical protein
MTTPEVSVMASLATAAVVFGVYQVALPNVADVRSLDKQNPDIESAERLASWTSAAIVAGISLVAGDPNIFIVGGAMVVVLAWWHRHADQVDNVTHRAVSAGSGSTLTPRTSEAEAPEMYTAPAAGAYDATF